MLGKRGFKVSICFALIVVLVLSFGTSNVLAETTKVVTVTKAASVMGPLSVVELIKREFISVTSYEYDDGSFKGTLRCSGISNWVQTYDHYDTVNQVPIFKFTFDATYSGTVTAYPATKTVTVIQPASAVGPLSVVELIKREFMSVTSYNYDDGTFKGILRCTEINNWVQTYDHYDTVNQVPVFKFTFDATYSGTVTQY